VADALFAELPEAATPPPLERIVEALLFVGGAPLGAARACEVVRGLTADRFAEVVAALNREYRAQGRPYHLRPREAGYELALRPAFRPAQERLRGSAREARLSQPALDVLSVVAYRQPVTRQEVDSIYGGDALTLLRQLVRLGLVAVQQAGTDQKEVCYNTTPRFLSLLGLRGLEDLPRTQDVQRM
jgi:segregation and condensation protein B